MFGTALLLIFPVLMIAAAASDVATMTIPNTLSLAVAGAFAIFVAAGGLAWDEVLLHLAAGALVLAGAFAMFAAGWIGGGDAKLAAATALWLGFDLLYDYLIIAALAGGFLTLAILVVRQHPLPAFVSRWTWVQRLHEPRGDVPYGLGLAVAALAVYPDAAVWSAVAHV